MVPSDLRMQVSPALAPMFPENMLGGASRDTSTGGATSGAASAVSIPASGASGRGSGEGSGPGSTPGSGFGSIAGSPCVEIPGSTARSGPPSSAPGETDGSATGSGVGSIAGSGPTSDPPDGVPRSGRLPTASILASAPGEVQAHAPKVPAELHVWAPCWPVGHAHGALAPGTHLAA